MDVDRLEPLARSLSSAGSRLLAAAAIGGSLLLATLGGAAGQAAIYSDEPPEDTYTESYYPDYSTEEEQDRQQDEMATLLAERWASGETWGDDEDEFCASEYTNWCIPPTWVGPDINCDELRDRGSVPIYLADPADDPYGLDIWDGVGDGVGCEYE